VEPPAAARTGFAATWSIYHGTYIAEVAEVTVSPRRELKVERAWAAVDAGRLVHPDRERN
jgi:CO/xanthine dehydrogenase Mo-binding subunit